MISACKLCDAVTARQHADGITELAGADHRRAGSLLWESRGKSELAVDPVPPGHHATIIAALSFFKAARLLDAEVEELTEVGVNTSGIQLHLRLPLCVPVLSYFGLVPGASASVAIT